MTQTGDEECTADPSLDATIDALADCRRRCVLYYFMKHDETVADADEVRDFVYAVCPDANDRSTVLVDLYHRVLPKLDDTGLIDFDDRSDTIRAHSRGKWKHVVESIREVEL